MLSTEQESALDLLASDLRAHREKFPRGGLPYQLRARGIALVYECVKAGYPKGQLASRLRLAAPTLRDWLDKGASAKSSSLVSVEVTPEVSAISLPRPTLPETMTLVSPEGWRIEGVSLQQALAIIRRGV